MIFRMIANILFVIVQTFPLVIGTFTLILIVLYVTFAESECARLPNGIVISDDAVFSFNHTYYRSSVVVKGPDGTIFSRGNDGLFYFSETTAWWEDLHPGSPNIHESKKEGLIWRADIGLVSDWSNRVYYKNLITEAGPMLEEGKLLNNTNVKGALRILTSDPKYNSRDCDVPLFTFEKSYP